MTAPPVPILAPGRSRRKRRRAFTLIEVLIALAIFLLAMAVFGSMIVRNGQVAAGIEQQNLATRLCQSKLHEVIAGVVPMSSQDDTPFDEEPDYTWSLEADNGAYDGLWQVTVTVKRQTSGGGEPVQCTLTQMVLDPSVVGSNEDVVPVTSSTTSGSSGTSGASSSSSTSSSSPTTGAAATPASSSPAWRRRPEIFRGEVTCDTGGGPGAVSPCSKSSWRRRSP